MRRRVTDLVASLTVAFAASYFIWAGADWDAEARLVPWTVCFVVLVLALAQSAVVVKALVTGDPASRAGGDLVDVNDGVELGTTDPQPGDEDGSTGSLAVILATVFAFALAIWLLGFRIGSAAMAFAFLRFLGSESLRTSLFMAAGVYLAFLMVFEIALTIPFPPGALYDLIGAPAPDSFVIDPVFTFIRRVLP